MRHYNGPSSWSQGHRWVSSRDGFKQEFHDAPPIGGIGKLQTYFNQQRYSLSKLLITKKTYE